jgi:hypothetical protein
MTLAHVLDWFAVAFASASFAVIAWCIVGDLGAGRWKPALALGLMWIAAGYAVAAAFFA